jgi:CIC family chloride channel protein
MKSKETSIPISPTLNALGVYHDKSSAGGIVKNRLFYIAVLSVIVAAVICVIARGLVYLINLVTNISFFGMIDARFHSPAANHLGLWVILVPAAGGIIVGLMALYGSKAIRGHGIPEAMEQILTNQSKIKPSITFLKPISSAIAIGTGGPFGAEGPIIATGGALGSTLGQLLKITANERKVVLAAGATAGMSAIFGTPIAAVLLAIELLLFEFSPKSILPVALACITGAAGHHLLFEAGPVFPMPELATPTNGALAIYSGIGLLIGFLSMGVTKTVYLIEDWFELLPMHWMWWPAIGGLAVGLIGYFAPHTLGVGYDNIISILSGTVSLLLVVRLCFFKFLSWAIALGSGTSGGTLAPLLTIGGAAGAIAGAAILIFFPNAGINIPMAALLGMSAMFAGASRAYLTSITFALEATMQSHALLPLLGACTAAYLVSFFLMENTIMTEKIARRGVATPVSFEPDVLGKLTVADFMDKAPLIISGTALVEDINKQSPALEETAFIVVDDEGVAIGMVKPADIFNGKAAGQIMVAHIMSPSRFVLNSGATLRQAVALMAKNNLSVLPVVSAQNTVIGSISYKNIITAYGSHIHDGDKAAPSISLKRQRLKILSRGRGLLNPKQ